jgi:hypothetical protein
VENYGHLGKATMELITSIAPSAIQHIKGSFNPDQFTTSFRGCPSACAVVTQLLNMQPVFGLSG